MNSGSVPQTKQSAFKLRMFNCSSGCPAGAMTGASCLRLKATWTAGEHRVETKGNKAKRHSQHGASLLSLLAAVVSAMSKVANGLCFVAGLMIGLYSHVVMSAVDPSPGRTGVKGAVTCSLRACGCNAANEADLSKLADECQSIMALAQATPSDDGSKADQANATTAEGGEGSLVTFSWNGGPPPGGYKSRITDEEKKESWRHRRCPGTVRSGKQWGSTLEIESHWRASCVKQLIEKCDAGCERKDIYQFGVFTGNSMSAIARAFHRANTNFSRMWGFDSFSGMPNDGTNNKTPIALGKGDPYEYYASKDWRPGKFNPASYYGSSNFAQQEWGLQLLVDDPRVSFVKGFFEKSLTDATAAMLPFREALYVDIDVDLYSSTVQVLEWMLKSKLIVKGTVLGYDDWGTGGEQGQKKAHNDVLNRFPGFEVRQYGNPGYKWWPGCFVVTSVPPR